MSTTRKIQFKILLFMAEIFGGISLLWLMYIVTAYNRSQELVMLSSVESSIQYINVFNQTNKTQQNNTTNISIPSLILLGPPKVGSRSFINTLQYSWIDFLKFGAEHYYFNGANHWRCTPHILEW
eukprot:202844_1